MASESAESAVGRPRPHPAAWHRMRHPLRGHKTFVAGVVLVVTVSTHGAPFVALTDALGRMVSG